MMDNCKQRFYLLRKAEQNKRQCNRFMAELHFDRSIALIVLCVSVFLFPYQHQVLADNINHSANVEELIHDTVAQIPEEKTQLPENWKLKTIATINHENNATYTELNRTQPHHEDYEQLKSDEEVITRIPPIFMEQHFNSVEHAVDVNNNIYTDVEESVDNTILPDLVNANPNHENIISTENLEESIRNSVKTEIELEQKLESSPVLEILKDLPEAEIRKTLTADIMSLDQQNFGKNFMLLQVAGQDNSEPEPIPELKKEYMENISKVVESSELKNENPRDSRNLQFQEAEHSDESSNVPDSEQLLGESSKAVNSSLTFSLANNSTDNSGDSFKTEEKDIIDNINQEPNHEITNIEEEDHTVSGTSFELPSKVNSAPIDFSIFIGDETEDNALSIVLNETFSTAEPYSGEDIPIHIEDNVELTTEVEEESITEIPEELEHIVVKKVLDIQGIFDDISETTLIPFEQLTQKTVVEEQSLDEKNYEDYLVTTKVYDDYNEDLNSKGYDDREAKLVNEYPNPELDNYNQELNTKGDNREAKLVNDYQNLDNYNQEFNTKAEDDHELKLVHEDQNPKADSKEEVHETKLKHEEQTPELNTENTNKLVDSKVKSSYNDEESVNLNNKDQTDYNQEQQVQYESYSANEQEESKLIPNNDFQSTQNQNKLVEHTENPINDENKSPYDKAATFFEAYLPRDSGQTFNNNLADEFAGIGKALPMSISEGSSRSTIIIVLSSGTALLFVVISLTIFLISFQRQNGTLDIEMQERSCGKDDLDDEDVETFSKLLEVELPPSIALALDDTEECL